MCRTASRINPQICPEPAPPCPPGEGNVIGEFSPSNTLQFNALRFVSQGRETRIDDISLFYNLLSPPLIKLLDLLAGRRHRLINLQCVGSRKTVLL